MRLFRCNSFYFDVLFAIIEERTILCVRAFCFVNKIKFVVVLRFYLIFLQYNEFYVMIAVKIYKQKVNVKLN